MPTIAELMTEDPLCVEPQLSALHALDLMVDRGIRHLPVVDRAGRIRGILTLDDLRAALPFGVSLSRPPSPEDRASAREWTVGELMTHGPLTVTPDATLAQAAAQLARFRIGCLPVEDAAGHLVGIFTETDALRAIALGGAARKPRSHTRALDLERLSADLQAERTRIASQLERTQESERALSAEQHDVPMDDAERARHLTEIATEEPLAALAASRLEAIDHALSRAARGQLGACEKCGRDIPIARLRALSGASQCVRCASQSEVTR
ncbi:MAG: CBS domain-containing protein [Myxococcota bacterium]